jgi:excisionase family DNA binding protein
VLLTVAEAARRASVSPSLIYAWCNEGTLPYTRIGRKGKRGHIRTLDIDLDGIMAGFKVTGQVAAPAPPKKVKSRPPLNHLVLKPS